MKTIYMIDPFLETPSLEKCKQCYNDVVNKELTQLDTSYTNSTRNWIKGQFHTMIPECETLGYDILIDNIYVTFFEDARYNVPEGFTKLSENLVALKIYMKDEGKYSHIQSTTIHEFTHATTLDYCIVGVAITEGLALFFQKMYWKNNDLPIGDFSDHDYGYRFSSTFVDTIFNTIYNGNLKEFLRTVKKGNENKFIEDIDLFLEQNKCVLNIKEILKLSSILFYAKMRPLPFLEEVEPKVIGLLRREVIDCFSKDDNKKDLYINEYKDSLDFILINQERITKDMDEDKKRTFLITLDREIGRSMFNVGADFLLDRANIISSFEKTAHINGITLKEKELFEADQEKQVIK